MDFIITNIIIRYYFYILLLMHTFIYVANYNKYTYALIYVYNFVFSLVLYQKYFLIRIYDRFTSLYFDISSFYSSKMI